LGAPFTYEELAAAVNKAANGMAPGLDDLSREWYRVTLPLVGPALLAVLNGMLVAGELGASPSPAVQTVLPWVLLPTHVFGAGLLYFLMGQQKSYQ
jgi:hypothetical protein